VNVRAPKAVIFGVVLAVALTPAAILVVLAVTWTPVAAVSGPFEDGRDAAERGDYKTAMSLWRPLAEQGDAAAQYSLGVLYERGQGVRQDDVEAVKWYRLAAKQGDAKAQSNLGLMYANGDGVPQDHAEAGKWFRLAAVQGNAEALSNLGYMYGHGRGIQQDYVLAHIWFTLAASRFPPGEEHDNAAKGQDWAAKHMTPAQIAKAQKLASEWKPLREQAD